MTKPKRTPTLVALLIAALLAGAYVIVAGNGSAMSRSGERPPAGTFH